MKKLLTIQEKMGYNANVCYEKEYLKLNISFRIFQGGGGKSDVRKESNRMAEARRFYHN